MRSDRTIELHSKNGKYYSTRIPKVRRYFELGLNIVQFGRDMMYNYSTCDIITCGASPFINRINLERGCFLKPMESSCPNLNVSDKLAVAKPVGMRSQPCPWFVRVWR